MIKAEKKSYTIVGLIERPDFEPYWAPGYMILTGLDENSPKTETVNVSVWQKHVDKNIYDDSKELAKKRQQTVKIFLIIQYCLGFQA